MKSIPISSVVILLFVAIAAFAQPSQDLFCNPGVPSNGYIDLAPLPTPLLFPGGKIPQLPGDRLPGPTVTVTITVLSLLRPLVL